MRFARLCWFLAPIVSVALSHAVDADACGACFQTTIQQSRGTQVSGHRMVLSISQAQTTLWDQISYVGAPASFAWVLPIKGTVDIGLSSDALFAQLEAVTKTEVFSPTLTCPPPPNCGGNLASGAGPSTGYSASSGGGGVTVVAEEVVGPYETVQLSSQDPAALQTWLASHGYEVPADMAPIIGAYVTEGFDFLAMKLVPGMNVQSMRPVRVTTPGATPQLPLRMVAGGTGALVPITLWIMGEGRYAPTNFPSFAIAERDLVWDWDTQSSNYKALRVAGLAAQNGRTWLIEAGEPLSTYAVESPLMETAHFAPASSGYADDMGLGAEEACAADLETLFHGIPPASLWVNRLYAELPRAALATDLEMSASDDQSWVDRSLYAAATKGTPPSCPEYPPCDPGSGASGAPDADTGSCDVTAPPASGATLAAAALLLALAVSRRRR